MADDTTPEDRIFMAKITGLEAVVRALVFTHHDPERLRVVAEKLAEGAKGALLATSWSDEEIQEIDHSVQALLSASGKRGQPQ